MKLKDILIMSANLLNLTDEVEQLESLTEENIEEILSNKKIQKLHTLAMTSLREICISYLPILAEVEVESLDKKIPTSTLPDCVKVLKVRKNDAIVPYKIKHGEIILKCDGLYTIQYVQSPKTYALLDELDIFLDLSPDILVLGVCAYYAVSIGMYDEFEYFHNEYLKRAESIKRLGIYQMPARRWL